MYSILHEFGGTNEPLALACFARLTQMKPADLDEFRQIGGIEVISRILIAQPEMTKSSSCALRCLSALARFSQLNDTQLLAVLCRIGRSVHPMLERVCRRWWISIRNEKFIQARRACPLTGISQLEPLVMSVGGSYCPTDENKKARISEWIIHAHCRVLMDGCWVQAAPAPLPVSDGHILVPMDEEVYCLGGNHNWVNNPAPMKDDRVGPCACVMVWSPRSNTWRAVPRMSIGRTLLSACSVDHCLYVFGGLTRMSFGDDIAQCEMYDASTNCWSNIPNMPIACHSARCVPIQHQIFLVGGAVMPGPYPIDLIQMYDTQMHTWTVLETLLPNIRCFAVPFGDEIICFGSGQLGSNWVLDSKDLVPIYSAVQAHSDRCLKEELSKELKKEEFVGSYVTKLSVCMCGNAAGICNCEFKDIATLQTEANELYIAGMNADGTLSRTSMKKLIQNDPLVHARLVPGSWKEFFSELVQFGTVPDQRQPKSMWLKNALKIKDANPREQCVPETWSFNTTSKLWTQLATAPKPHYGEMGYFYLVDGVIRAVEDNGLNFNICRNKWEADPQRQLLPNFSQGPHPAVISVPF